MAAKAIHGYGGIVNWDSSDIEDEITSWSVTMTVDTADTTGMGSTTISHGRITGLKDWTGSFEGPADDSGPHATEGSEATCQFWLTQGTVGDGYLSGNAIVTGLSVSQSPNDAGRITYNIQGNGELTWAVA